MSSTLRDSVAAQGAGAQIYQLNSAADGAGGLLLGGGYYGNAAVVNTAVLPSKTDGEAAFAAKADAAGEVTWSRSDGTQAERSCVFGFGDVQ